MMIRPEFTETEAQHLFRAIDQVVRAGGIDAAELLGPIASKLRAAYAQAKAEQQAAQEREAVEVALARREAEKAREPT
jgi:hypothetical protein